MKPIAVVPARATERAAPLLRATGWNEAPPEPANGDERADAAEVAIKVVRRGDPALYMPEAATPPERARRILVVHAGTRGDRTGMDAADEAAVASGAEIVVLHVPPAQPPTASGSLVYRIADHGIYDWAEWQAEFLRRFCRCSPGVRVSVRVSSGERPLADQVRAAKPDLVIVSTTGQLDASGGGILDAVLGGEIPVLLLPSVGRDRSARYAAELGQVR
jgi:hypothetical protein